jgi:hypothetical protein
MGQWIKCTMYDTRRVCYLNLAHVIEMYQLNSATRIRAASGTEFDVRETPDELLAQAAAQSDE